MDFIEVWLGLAPDSGDGTLEMLFIVCLAAAAVLLVYQRYLIDLARRWLLSAR
ncbi:MAG TPA: hypothetical protein VH682_15140 [Gemmataceae bacterium]|jgi:hypothetical protein